MRARCHGPGELGEMSAHGERIGMWPRPAQPWRRGWGRTANGDAGALAAGVARAGRTRGARTRVAGPSLVLEPHGLVSRLRGQALARDGGGVLLNNFCANRFRRGRCGRTDGRRNSGAASCLPAVRSCMAIPKRHVITRCKPTCRQRTTPSVPMSGPSRMIRASSAFCPALRRDAGPDKRRSGRPSDPSALERRTDPAPSDGPSRRSPPLPAVRAFEDQRQGQHLPRRPRRA